MTQHQLDRQIARITGDDLATIRRRGFSLIDPSAANLDDERDPLTVDWDAVDAQRALTQFPA